MAVMGGGWDEMERSGSWKGRGVCHWAGGNRGDEDGGRERERERCGHEWREWRYDGQRTKQSSPIHLIWWLSRTGHDMRGSGVGAIPGRLVIHGGVAPRNAVVNTPASHWAALVAK